MKLIIANESPLRLIDSTNQPYVILSHRWFEASEEVSLQEFESPSDEVQGRKGYKKIERFCQEVARGGLRAENLPVEHVWVDTCCIDKKDPNTQSEDINSMFKYYENAEVCYVYLHDVLATQESPATTVGDGTSFGEQLANSAWFKRGWTLQELIAPKRVVFFNGDWKKLGTREELRGVLSSITGIGTDVLIHKVDLQSISIAHRMSWAASRETKRPEDIAYCLLGIFDVFLSLQYGEGAEKAFTRLQEEIIKRSDDQSLFAWQPLLCNVSTPILKLQPVELSEPHNDILAFARSPKNFAETGHIRPYYPSWGKASMLAGEKLAVEWPLFVAPKRCWDLALKDHFRTKAGALYLAVLCCTTQSDKSASKCCAILLQHITQAEFVRYPGVPLLQVDKKDYLSRFLRDVNIRRQPVVPLTEHPMAIQHYWNRNKSPGGQPPQTVCYWRKSCEYLAADNKDQMMLTKYPSFSLAN